jgi:DNA-binding MarR family transcriptional regulator
VSLLGESRRGGDDPDMPGPASTTETLTLHAVRLLGYASVARVAARFGLERAAVEEHLLDGEARGWVTRSRFGGDEGWSLTDRGRTEDERRLAAELEQAGARPVVADVHQRFLPLNGRFQQAATRWQIRPLPGDPMAANDHQDFRWDDRVLDDLRSVGRRLRPLEAELAGALSRFGGYADRYDAALDRVVAGHGRWVDEPGVDSCHVVWMQLHEDLLSTLGLERGDEQA